MTNPVLGMFPMYHLTVGQVSRVESKSYAQPKRALKKIIIQHCGQTTGYFFYPKSLALNETMVQGIFASEREINQMECTRNSIFNRFITIVFDEKNVKRSKVQAIEEYGRER